MLLPNDDTIHPLINEGEKTALPLDHLRQCPNIYAWLFHF